MAAKKTTIPVPNGELGIYLKQEPDLGLTIFASQQNTCKIPNLIGSRLISINKIPVNDLKPWIVAEIIKMKKNKTFTVIKNSIPIANEISSHQQIITADYIIVD
tara:strand:- start:39 stop:350 length:312 start_codon:yes stop_codon:yes gene_type:complete